MLRFLLISLALTPSAAVDNTTDNRTTTIAPTTTTAVPVTTATITSTTSATTTTSTTSLFLNTIVDGKATNPLSGFMLPNSLAAGWDIPITLAYQRYTVRVTAGSFNSFLGDGRGSCIGCRAMEDIIADLVGALPKYVTCAMESLGGNGLIKTECAISIPSDGSPARVGPGLDMATAMSFVDVSDLAAKLGNKATSLSGSNSFSTSFSSWQLAEAVDIYPNSVVAMNCVQGGCLFRQYELNTHWTYHKQTSLTSLSECKSACLTATDCTGIEWPEDGTYCAFWKQRACTVTKQPLYFEARSGIQTCSKRDDLIIDVGVDADAARVVALSAPVAVLIVLAATLSPTI